MIKASLGTRRRLALVGMAAVATTALAAALAANRPASGARDGGEACSALDASAARGRRIFRKGETAKGPVQGWLAGDAAALTGRDAACGSCHGPAGAGNEEGGVSVPSIRPERLFAARERGYDGASLAVALGAGRTPEGRSLRAPMPRYRLDDAERSDLGAYLRCLGRERDPGVTDEAVRVGAALPLSGPEAEIGAAVRDALTAAFAEINGRGGVFRRRIDLVVEDSAAGGGTGAEERLISLGVLALVASMGRKEGGESKPLDEAEIPQILPLGAAPERVGERAFYLHTAEDQLARVAVTHLARAGKRATILVIGEAGAAASRWITRTRDEARARGLPAPAVLTTESGSLDPLRVVDAARAAASEALLFTGSARDFPAVLAALDGLPGATLYAPAGALAGSVSLPARVVDQVLFLHAGLTRAAFHDGATALSATLRSHGVAGRYPAFQASAVVAARVLEEGLRRAGSPPTRDELVTALESLRDFQTGLAPPLTFGRNRHVGVLGAHVLRIGDAQGTTARASTWIGLTP